MHPGQRDTTQHEFVEPRFIDGFVGCEPIDGVVECEPIDKSGFYELSP